MQHDDSQQSSHVRNVMMCNRRVLYDKRHGGYKMLSRSGDVTCIPSCESLLDNTRNGFRYTKYR
jgi:hypothetical protein